MQLVEHCARIAEVTGSNPVEALIFFSGFFPIAQIGKFTAMIALHFHLQPQYKYELFHINFTTYLNLKRKKKKKMQKSIITLHSSWGYELNKLTSLPMCGFIAQLLVRASHQYRGLQGHGFESHWSPDFFRLLLFNCFNWKINCDDHSSLSSTTAVQIWIISYTLQSINQSINDQ